MIFNIFLKGWIPFLKEEKITIANLMLFASIICFILRLWSFCFMVLTYSSIILARKLLAGGFCCNDLRLDGQTIIITGSNTGIGKETAKDLAKRGANIIIACRDVKKGEQAALEVKEGAPTSIVIVEKLDLASFRSIREFAQKILLNYSKIDTLINNAGVMMCPFTKTEDGLEMQMGTNHIGHFLLTKLLLPLLTKGHKARIINVSSMGHKPGVIPLDDFYYEKGYGRFQAYFNSKLANILHVRQLAKQLKGTQVQVFSLHPGAVQSELARHLPLYFLANFQHYMCKSTLEGAQTSVYCATEAVQASPYYYSDCELASTSALGSDDELAEKLWDLSEKIVKNAS